MDEFSADKAEPVSMKIAVTKLIIVKLPAKNDNTRAANEMRMDRLASIVTGIGIKHPVNLYRNNWNKYCAMVGAIVTEV